MRPEEKKPVRLAGVPTALYLQLHAYVDDLLRELALIEVSDDYGLPSWWLDAWEQAAAAERSGRDEVDLELEVPPDGVDHLAALFEKADGLSRAGLLLTTDTSPRVRELRDRVLRELSDRVRDGHEP